MSSHMVMLYHQDMDIESILEKLYVSSVKPEIAIVSGIENQTQLFLSFPNNCIVGKGLFQDWLSARLQKNVIKKGKMFHVNMASKSPVRKLYEQFRPNFKVRSS